MAPDKTQNMPQVETMSPGKRPSLSMLVAAACAAVVSAVSRGAPGGTAGPGIGRGPPAVKLVLGANNVQGEVGWFPANTLSFGVPFPPNFGTTA